MSTLPSGTVTFLFTDIEGSTHLLQRLGTRYAGVLAKQQELLSAQIESHRGQIIDTQGDSFFVAFPRALDAVNAVVAAQRALAAYDWGDGGAVRVRMGLHTGEPTVAGERYIGIDVHRAARIGAAGHGGQVLLSETTHALVKDDLPEGVTLRDLGEHHLKDLRTPKHLYQLVIPDLPADFPPPKTLDYVPNNLPLQLTSFVGREREIQAVKDLVTKARFVTLTGSGGAGKTRLSLEVAGELLDATRFKDGIWLVELAPLADPEMVPRAVAATLGVREEVQRPLLDSLTDYIGGKTMLFVLDNCEHVIEASAVLTDTLLRKCPNLKILASSREPLGVAGEMTYRLPSLALPHSTRVTPETLPQYDAARLFIERIRAAQPSFAVTNANAAAIAQICTRLDGIPLALELAAARARVLSVEQIASKLDDRFRLLTGGSRGTLPRQQTLRATIDWSYGLLTQPERVLLRRLAVFAGGWTLTAAEFVSTGESLEEFEILDLLTRLVDKSLVVVIEQDGSARYHFLETIRQYARDKLLEADEAARARDRHLEFFADLAVDDEPRLYTGEQVGVLNQLETEHDNFRAALEWGSGRNEIQGLRLAGALGRFWHVRGYHVEGRAWLDKLLAQNSPAVPAHLRAKALCENGILAMFQSDAIAAEPMIQESIAICREREDTRGLAYGLTQLGALGRWQGDNVRAQTLLREAIQLCRTSDFHCELGMALFWQSATAYWSKDYELARTSALESIRIFALVGDNNNRAAPVSILGRIAADHGDYETAAARFTESYDLLAEVQDKVGIAIYLEALGNVELKQGKLSQAAAHFCQSLLLWQPIGTRENVAWIVLDLAEVALAEQAPVRAARLMGAGSTMFEQGGIQSVPLDQQEFDRIDALVRAGLSEEAFQRAWEEGRSLNTEQAVELALGVDSPTSKGEWNPPL